MTTKTIDWLNLNRFRAYPFINDNGLVCGESRIPDCVLLDCLVVDTSERESIPSLVFNKIDISENKTVVSFDYGGNSASYDLAGGELSGDGSFVKVSGTIPSGTSSQFVYVSMTFSSHAYIKDKVGTGTWTFQGLVFPSKIVSVRASGVSGIKTNGSKEVQTSGTATGIVHLVDGYRTQPVVSNGKLVVKVGTSFGIDPCHYPRDTTNEVSCDDLMLFFCGQNSINSGNVVLMGGPGVSVQQGRTYTAKEDILDTYGQIGISKGENIPCIEVVAASELLRIYRPTPETSSSQESPCSSSSGESSPVQD